MVSFTSKIPLRNRERERKKNEMKWHRIRMIFVPLQNNVENDKIMTWIGKIENKSLLFLPVEKKKTTTQKIMQEKLCEPKAKN